MALKFFYEKKKHDLTQAYLKEWLIYNPDTGMFTWKQRPYKSNLCVGEQAGGVRTNAGGYKGLAITIKGRVYPSYQLAWLYMKGEWVESPNVIKFIDSNPLNIKWGNLEVELHNSYIPLEDKDKIFIYGLEDPETGEIRYIGKAKKPKYRYREHLCPSEIAVGSPKSLWLKSLLDKGLKPVLKILDETNEKDWEETERVWISKFTNLVNSIDGSKNVRSNKENRYSLTQEYLKDIIRYEPDTGNFYWLVSRQSYAGKVHIGAKAGQIKTGKGGGYILIGIDGVIYRAHILAYFYMTGEWPPQGIDIDHKDQNRANNAWINLKKKTRGQNNHNTKIFSTNKSGYKGVSWSKIMGKWLARITVNKKIIDGGYFDLIEDAVAKRKELEEKYATEIGTVEV